jgi:hypothetical protein
MVQFDVETIGQSPEDMQDRLTMLGGAAEGKANEALREVAEDVQDDLEDTSPVDTGEYQDSWYGPVEVAEDEVWILNEADHAKFVMLPNSKMVGSSKADLPSAGILHNVKGVAKRHSDDLNLTFGRKLKELIRGIKR